MKEQLIKHIKANWRDFGLMRAPRRVNFFIKNKYRKLTFFFFIKGRPLAIAKFTPFPRDKDEIRKEYEILLDVHSYVGPNLKKTIPKPISLVEIDGHPVMFQQFLPGKTMASTANAFPKTRHLDRNFKRAVNWLIDFNNCYKKKAIILDEKSINKLFIEPVNTIIRNNRSLSKEDFNWLFEKTKSMKSARIHLISKHTDFWPGNILMNKEKLAILDWEDFGLSELPLFDLFHFIVSYFLAMNLNKKDENETFYKTFFTMSKYRQNIRSYVKKYCRAFSIDMNLLDVYFAMYLVEFYNLRHEQEGPGYGVTKRSGEFLKIFLRNRNSFILDDIR